MNKADLNQYNVHTNVSDLVDEISTLLKTYNHRYSEHGICTMLDTYFQNKSALIEMFKKSPHYVGDMRIRIPIEMARTDSANDVRAFCNAFTSNINAYNILTTFTDESGKTAFDYLKTGKRLVKVSDLDSLNSTDRLVHLNQFDHGREMRYNKSVERYNKFADIMGWMAGNYQTTISSRTASRIDAQDNSLKVRQGMKTSRVFNKICETYGVHNAAINKVEATNLTTGEVRVSNKYDKLFAQYSDMVSSLKRNVDFIISLNPYDYLTMSFGVNWASCHSIDKTNKRNISGSYSGQYCAGTMSYMLDNNSIITYVIERDGDAHDGKIYRNMFHYNTNTLIQSRGYPQGNDGNTDLYTIFRELMQTEVAAMLNKPNEWVNIGGRDEISDVVWSDGVQYPDYRYNRGCNMSGLRDEVCVNEFRIGALPICTKCGATHSIKNMLSHSSC